MHIGATPKGVLVRRLRGGLDEYCLERRIVKIGRVGGKKLTKSREMDRRQDE
jgi:hypothetical protein